MGRGERASFNQPTNTGRLAYRTEEEPIDERPLLFWPDFWRDRLEQTTYEAAVQGNPRRPDEGPMSYIRRLSAIVTGELGSPFGRMP